MNRRAASSSRRMSLRVLAENRDLLRNSVFRQTEIVLRQIADWCALLVGNGHINVDQFYIDLESGLRRFLCRNLQKQDCKRQSGCNCLHQARSFGSSRLTRNSSGKGSPSAQTTPSEKCSFFQIGTVRFKVSIAKRQASKAAARCADATTIRTLVSPISTRPSRCTIAISRILWLAKTFSARVFIWLSAIGSYAS